MKATLMVTVERSRNRFAGMAPCNCGNSGRHKRAAIDAYRAAVEGAIEAGGFVASVSITGGPGWARDISVFDIEDDGDEGIRWANDDDRDMTCVACKTAGHYDDQPTAVVLAAFAAAGEADLAGLAAAEAAYAADCPTVAAALEEV